MTISIITCYYKSSLPGGSPVMSRTVQQGSHVRLISPSNIDNQHTCRTKTEEFLSCYTTDPVQRNDYAFWQNTKCAEAWKWCQRVRQMWNCDGNIYPCCCGRVCWFKAAALKNTVVQVDIVRPLSLSEASDWLIATKRLGWDSAAVSAAEPA